MKKMLSLLAAAALTASLAGCGASKSYASAASRPAIAETAEGAYGVSDDLDAGFNGSGESAVLPEASSARKIIYTSQLDVETRDFDSSHTLLRSTACSSCVIRPTLWKTFSPSNRSSARCSISWKATPRSAPCTTIRWITAP